MPAPVPIYHESTSTLVSGAFPALRVNESSQTAQEAADSVSDELKSRPPQYRYLEIKNPTIQIDTSSAAALISVVTNGVDVSTHTTWIQAVIAAILANGADVKLIFYDMEDNFGTFANGVNQAEVQAVLDDVGAAAMVPDYVKAFTASQINSSSNKAGTDAWNSWASWEVSYAMRALKGSIESAAGHGVAVTNYKDSAGSHKCFSRGGFRENNATLSNIGAPECYFDNNGDRYDSLTKHRRWNSMIDSINLVRSEAAVGRKVMPWIPGPSYETSGGVVDEQHRWSWRQTIHEIWMVGNVIAFQYFNPFGGTFKDEDDLFASEVFEELGALRVGMKGPAEVLADAEFLPQTGMTYDEALPNLHDDPSWIP